VLAVIAAAALGLWTHTGLDRLLLVVAAVVFLIGVQVPTATINIPLNNRIQRLDVAAISDAARRDAREMFERSWNRWNVRRLVGAVLVSVLRAARVRGTAPDRRNLECGQWALGEGHRPAQCGGRDQTEIAHGPSGGLVTRITVSRVCAGRQFSVGRSRRSMTRVSTAARAVSSLRPSCSRSAVNTVGASLAPPSVRGKSYVSVNA
jgi:hypothetical protein